MAGHSKWANIKHKKAKVDAQRGAAFQKCSREIIVASKMGGADPASNFRLRTAIEKAKSAELPSDTIKRAIEKGSGEGDSDNYEELTYEGYGPGGVAVFIEAMTDNKNRTAGEVRSYFTKHGGNLGANGCVDWMFKQIGQITILDADSEKLFDDSINAGAADFQEDDGEFKVITEPADLQNIVEKLEKNYTIEKSEITRTPENNVEITDIDTAKSLIKMLDKLEENDDVQNVYSNFEIDDSILENIE